MTFDQMPYNQLGADPAASGAQGDVGTPGALGAQDIPGVQGASDALDVPDEATWRASNLPSSSIEFAWRCAHGELVLFERRVRSLAAFGVGPAVQAWVRERLEWMVDNRLPDNPDGVLVLSIGPEGDVGMSLRDVGEAPTLGEESLFWDAEGRLVGCGAPVSVWQVAGSEARMRDASGGDAPRAAADTFARDVLATMDIALQGGGPTRHTAGDAGELFCVSDEHGVIACDGKAGPAVAKLELCFGRLWG